MKLEDTEKLFISSLFKESTNKLNIALSKDLLITKLTGDASTRRYYRIKNDSGSFVACLDNPSSKVSSISNFYEIQQVFIKEKIRVPKIFDVNFDSGYLLLEDLGNSTLLEVICLLSSEEEELSLYKNIVDKLIIIHNTDIQKYKKKEFTNLSFNYEKLYAEIEFTFDYFLHDFLQNNLTNKEVSVLKNSFQEICKILGGKNKILTHRDFHSRNIMVKDEELIIIDFQDARMGLPQYDLASLLDDCYYELTANNKEKLKKYYWNNFMKDKKIQSNYEEFIYLYDMMTIQRVFKAIGSFSYIYSLRKDIRYIKYIGFAFEKIRIILMKYPEYSKLRQVLSKVYYAN